MWPDIQHLTLYVENLLKYLLGWQVQRRDHSTACEATGNPGRLRSKLQIPFSERKWVFPKIVVPQNGWFRMENPIKMDDLGIPLFSETSKSTFPHVPTHLKTFNYWKHCLDSRNTCCRLSSEGTQASLRASTRRTSKVLGLGGNLDYTNVHVYMYIPRTQMTLVLIRKGLVFFWGGWPLKIEVIGALGIYMGARCTFLVPPPPPTPMVWSPPYPTVLAATVVVLVLVLPSTSTT